MQFQFSLLSLLALSTLGLTIAIPQPIDDLSVRSPSPIVERSPQTTPAATTAPASEEAAMTDKDGNIVKFDSTAVYLPAAAAGL